MSTLDTLNSFIISQYGDNLISLYTYGNQLSEPALILNMLLIVKSGDISQFRRYASKKKPTNTEVHFSIFTQEEILKSIDVFPIEFLEMQQTRQLLSGPDLLADVSINLTNLRHECEYTLRSNILKLRSALLSKNADFAALVRESFPIFFSTFLSIFSLKGVTVPADTASCLDALSSLTNVSLTAFSGIIHKKQITESDVQIYLDVLSSITGYVDEI
jgi:hypothetical protein